uniref:Putative basic tail protein n=1 Tax=Rhipicephalus pulchellus TaxID=72859 RepID=L7LU07_RHIPC
MFDLRLLWMLLLPVLQSTEGAILACPPGTPEKTPVPHCNYYCGKNQNDVWRMGYYINGTACEYPYEDKIGICAVVSGHYGCYWHKDEDVRHFLKDSTKAPKSTKKPRKKKPKTTSTTTKLPKRKKPKKPKKSSKTKQTKKASGYNLPEQPKW